MVELRLNRRTLLHGRVARWIKWRACDVGEAKERLENELWRSRSDGRVGEWAVTPSLRLRHSSFSYPSVSSSTSHLLVQPFFCFSYITTHSRSFSKLSVTSPTSQFIVQPFGRFTYVTAHSPTLPFLHLRHSSFSNPSFATPTSQALHLRHLAFRPCSL